MKNKHLRERLKETLKAIQNEDGNAQISRECITEIAVLSKVFVTEALSILKKSNKLSVENDWLLVIFSAHDMHAEFDIAFEKLCKNGDLDFSQVYEYSCSFFYRHFNSNICKAESTLFHKVTICSSFGETIYKQLLDKLKRHKIITV